MLETSRQEKEKSFRWKLLKTRSSAAVVKAFEASCISARPHFSFPSTWLLPPLYRSRLWGEALLFFLGFLSNFVSICLQKNLQSVQHVYVCCVHRSFSFIVANLLFLKCVACVCDTDHTGVFGSLAHLHCFRPGIQHCSHLPLKHKKLMLTYKHACLAKMLVFIVLLLSDVAALCSHRRSLNQYCVFCLILHDGGAAALLPVMSGRLRCYC